MNAFAPRSSAGLAALLGGLALAALLSSGPGRAEDENMSTSAYLVLDPETGELVTVHDPNRTSRHAAEQPSAALPAGEGQKSADGPEAGRSMPAFAAAGVGVVVAGAAALVWFRRKQPKET